MASPCPIDGVTACVVASITPVHCLSGPTCKGCVVRHLFNLAEEKAGVTLGAVPLTNSDMKYQIRKVEVPRMPCHVSECAGVVRSKNLLVITLTQK